MAGGERSSRSDHVGGQGSSSGSLDNNRGERSSRSDHVGGQGSSSGSLDNNVVSQRRINSAARILAGDPDDAVRVLSRLEPEELSHVGEVVHQLERERAVASGDHDQIIDLAFEEGFGSDGLGHPPWIQGAVIVAPGSIINKSKTNHRCRFISVNDTWVWDSIEVIREDKRSIPGTSEGFKAVALLPILNGMALDVVTGRARAGQHQVDRVVSYKVKRGKLVEVAQRNVKPQGMR